ncbi:hypothetical protein [Paremcibacter congregatus]|uniref:hypothetical protein n=1 Tax=Paremcibacter congregatus TaxID=2043170 RepID=UPI003A94384F
MPNRRVILWAALLFSASLALGLPARAERALTLQDRSDPLYWQTDHARLLDSDPMRMVLQSLRATAAKKGTENILPPDEVSSQITNLLLAEQTRNEAIHIQTTLTTVGALSGFACQMAIRDGLIAEGKITLDKALVTVKTTNGETFFTGPFLNECLITDKKGQHSVWGFVGGAALHLGKPLPDVTGIFAHTGATIGQDSFGAPELPEQHLPQMSSEALLWKYWNIIRNTLVLNEQPPAQWPLIIGLSAQQLILESKDAIDPTIAAQIVMEAAVPMSHLDPARIHEASLSEPNLEK